MDTIIKLNELSINGLKGVDANKQFDQCIRIYKSSPGSANLQIRYYGKCSKNNYKSKQKPDRYIFSAQLNKNQLYELQKAITNLLNSKSWS